MCHPLGSSYDLHSADISLHISIFFYIDWVRLRGAVIRFLATKYKIVTETVNDRTPSILH